MRDILRRVRFQPYRKDMGPTFTLTTWDTGRTDEYGKSILGYRMTMTAMERTPIACVRPSGKKAIVLFEGEDFHCAPGYAIDGDKAIASLMGFLTLRPGDADPDYFADYTAEQRRFCEQHAETLMCESMARFGEE